MIQSEHSLLQHVKTMFDSGTLGELTDRQLLDGFAERDRDIAELCFAALIKRHGAMVFRTCHAVLHDRHDAEDAFQATFLVLARKARSLWIRDSLGPWLFQVACSVAACARAAILRRRVHEREAARSYQSAVGDKTWDDGDAVVCEELQRLPVRYRAAIMLCDLEGLTQERAAAVLGWPAGTMRSRLARGRQRLRDRLTRRGLAPTVVPVLPWLAGDGILRDVPATLAQTTTQTAMHLVGNPAALATIASVGSLTEGALRIMFWNKLKLITAGILASALFAGTALMAYWATGSQEGRLPAQPPVPPARNHALTNPRSIAPESEGTQTLSPSAKARLDVARKLRDKMFDRVQVDPSFGSSEVLACQNRYEDVISDVFVKTDADRVRFLEHRVATLKQIEQYYGHLFKNGQMAPTDPLSVELYRLDAEDRLVKARAKLKASGAGRADAVSSQLEQFLKQDPGPPLPPKQDQGPTLPPPSPPSPR
jgi:RNA polymerase sigma factor (sigma-70 family)